MKYQFNTFQNTIAFILMFLQVAVFAQVPLTQKKKGNTITTNAAIAPKLVLQTAKNSDTPAKEVTTINDLRNLAGNPDDLIYVKYHSTPRDAGGGYFMWRKDSVLTSNSYFGKDNNGTYIKVKNNNEGRWVRQYTGPITISYFGADTGNATKALQSAIDFAYNNQNDYAPTKGNTVLIPASAWIIDTIELKNGVEITGDSEDFTLLYSKIKGEKGFTNAPYMFEVPAGPAKISVANLKILAREGASNQGCFHFKAAAGPAKDGGLWLSTFKKIEISGFKGNGIYSEAGDNGSLPNQLCVFEQVHVVLGKGANSESCALKMTGQHGQMTFINSGFNGYRDGNAFHKGNVISIAHAKDSYSAVVSFINCTIQEGDYGININYAENITIDNCWFENLGIAINVDGTDHEDKANTNYWCRGINVLNNRFANAAGYGSIPASAANTLQGICVNVINSQVTVANNYVAASELNNERLSDDYFIVAQGLPGDINPGVESYGNSFATPKLGRTAGIVPTAAYILDNTIECRHNKVITINRDATISTINSTLNAGETVYIKAVGASITLKEFNGSNILLANKRQLVLEDGEVAGFTKIDTQDGGLESYQLTSVIKNQ